MSKRKGLITERAEIEDERIYFPYLKAFDFQLLRQNTITHQSILTIFGKKLNNEFRFRKEKFPCLWSR